ncbi:MAG: hypothetical protein C0597_12200 [Marinilabiliales bacterium]|nr:MAG: hypothetical protein C0597_12200 [Marinilabiliales bacterium]
MKIANKIGMLIILMGIGIISGCEDYFEYSPYAANVKSQHQGSHENNLQNIIEADTIEHKEYKFAVIADSHYNYHELNEAIMNINGRNDLAFVIANGDLADHGYLKEYELFHNNMDKLVPPYLTVIGNHDYKSNGIDVYKQMFGEPNKTFTFNNNLFILFDDVFWESNKTPDFDWLEDQLKTSSIYEHVFVVCHIPPYGEQFTEQFEEKYKNLMLQYSVDLSIHGHVHRYIYGDYYGDGMNYLSVESIMDKEYGIITVNENGVFVESIKY